MTPREINIAVQRYWISYLFIAIAFFLAVSQTQIIASAITRFLSSHGIDFRLNTVHVAVLVFIVLFMLTASFIAQKLIIPGCQSCKKGFTANNCRIVIATKNCPYCGERVIAENP